MTEAIGVVYARPREKRKKRIGAATELRTEVSPTSRASRPHSLSATIVSLSLAYHRSDGERER